MNSNTNPPTDNIATYQFQLLPDLAATEYESLKADIAQNGVLVPVEVDQNGDILDGHHRVRAWQELTSAGVTLPDYPRLVRRFDDDDTRIEHALKLNLQRRHLTREQLQEISHSLRKRGWQNPKIAAVLGVDAATVWRWNSEIADAISELGTITNERGQERPSTYRRRDPAIIAATSDDEKRARELTAEGFWTVPTFGGEPSVISTFDARPHADPRIEQLVHVSHNSGENEWYTPPELITAARDVLGEIDLDPASSPVANKTVAATTFYTKHDNGLIRKWHGRVFLNPPYAQPLIQQFADKLVAELMAGNVAEAIVLVNNATETTWFQTMAKHCTAVTFPRGRVKFIDPGGNPSGAPLQGQAILYFGPETRRQTFVDRFAEFGVTL